MVEFANTATVHRAAVNEASDLPVPDASRQHDPLTPLAAVDLESWRGLAERAVEPNGYYLPDWELAVSASARGRNGASALSAWYSAPTATGSGAMRLVGLIPVIPLWQAYKIPLPALVSADPYGSLGTPLLDRDCAHEAVAGLIAQARNSGARALILRDMSLAGATMQAFRDVLDDSSLAPRLLTSHARACLDATREPEALLREALGPKKLKELRRQRNRLAEHGGITFDVAQTPADIAAALEVFLMLESSGWKARRGTALSQHAGDAAFIRRATAALAVTSQCEIMTLRAGSTPVAAAVVLRHHDRAFYFKLGIDERFAKLSPGVQLTLDVTRRLCADPAIAIADSTASAGHPMIDPIWRGRLAIGDLLIPLRPLDPVAGLIGAALTSRRLLREPARRLLHLLRKSREILS